MKTLMIVDDEEIVRNSMVQMVETSGVPVEAVIAFSNGREALDYLEEHEVDVIFTDIHMPGMDGCELTGKIAQLESWEGKIRPKVVVISESKDFQCMIDLLKYGARDYILKPASADKVRETLQKLEIEISREKMQQEELNKIYRQHFRKMLKNPEEEDPETCEILSHLFGRRLGPERPFRLILSNPSKTIHPCSFDYRLTGVSGDLYFVAEKDINAWRNAGDHRFCLGASRKHASLGEILNAYQEALAARKVAWIFGRQMEEYQEYHFSDEQDLSGEIDKFLQQIPTDKMEAARKHFQNLFFEARHHHISPFSLLDMAEKLTERLAAHYANIYSSETGGHDCPRPLDMRNADSFLESFDLWIYGCQDAMAIRTNSVQKTDKICQAIEYINENYQKDLNLAIVSNHVSMNYSMFSNAFKQYTGVNFVNYLKSIRIAEARRLLVETNEKVAEVGAHVGYQNDKHFMKTFKAICGVSPSEYRRNMERVRSRSRRAQETQ